MVPGVQKRVQGDSKMVKGDSKTGTGHVLHLFINRRDNRLECGTRYRTITLLYYFSLGKSLNCKYIGNHKEYFLGRSGGPRSVRFCAAQCTLILFCRGTPIWSRRHVNFDPSLSSRKDSVGPEVRRD